MSTMAASRSTLNPNAPLFIPAAFQQVEDFSPEWWDLVKTTTWFRDYWFHQHQEQETFDGDDEDVANLLPDSFDLGIADELSILEAEFEAAAYHQTVGGAEGLFSGVQKKDELKTGLESEAEAVIRSLNLKSPKYGRVRPVMESARYPEKPMQCVSPKGSARRLIQQPR